MAQQYVTTIVISGKLHPAEHGGGSLLCFRNLRTRLYSHRRQFPPGPWVSDHFWGMVGSEHWCTRSPEQVLASWINHCNL